MKTTPMLFQGEMVRAILECRKTQTRRIVKPQPPAESGSAVYNPSRFEPDRGWYWRPHGGFAKCPYGQPGDLIWVRETFRVEHTNERRSLYYRADEPWHEGAGWKPSIHMPRWASRITLPVTDVRVERVQDISDSDAVAEGISPQEVAARGWVDARVGFRDLWNSINGKPKPVKVDGEIVYYESFPWEDVQELRQHRGMPWYVHGNPWVWSISFRPILANVGDVLSDPEAYGIEGAAA